MSGNVKSKILSTLTLAVVCLLLFSVGFYSLAWFSTMIDSGDLGFTTGELDDGTLEIAKIVYPDDSAEELDESDRQYYDCNDMHFEHASLPESNANGYTISMSQMSFGRIDNVALLKPENVVYFKLAVPKINGESVKIKFYFDNDDAGNFADIYKNTTVEGVTVQQNVLDTTGGEELLDAFQALEDAEKGNSFLRFSAHVSNTEYEATELSELTYYGKGGNVADESSDAYYKFCEFSESSDGAVFVNEDFETADEYYYVYIRVEPNLSVFGQSIETISSVMPCYVYFKIMAYFEMYEGGVD